MHHTGTHGALHSAIIDSLKVFMYEKYECNKCENIRVSKCLILKYRESVNWHHFQIRFFFTECILIAGPTFIFFTPTLVLLAVVLTETFMHQMFIMNRTEKESEKQGEAVGENPGGARKIENISEPLPGMIGFICYPVIPWAVMRGWSG